MIINKCLYFNTGCFNSLYLSFSNRSKQLSWKLWFQWILQWRVQLHRFQLDWFCRGWEDVALLLHHNGVCRQHCILRLLRARLSDGYSWESDRKLGHHLQQTLAFRLGHLLIQPDGGRHVTGSDSAIFGGFRDPRLGVWWYCMQIGFPGEGSELLHQHFVPGVHQRGSLHGHCQSYGVPEDSEEIVQRSRLHIGVGFRLGALLAIVLQRGIL